MSFDGPLLSATRLRSVGRQRRLHHVKHMVSSLPALAAVLGIDTLQQRPNCMEILQFTMCHPGTAVHPACLLSAVYHLQVRGELATVFATSVLSILGTLYAVYWVGTPLHVKYSCAGSMTGVVALEDSQTAHGEATQALGNSHQQATAQWLAQVTEAPCTPADVEAYPPRRTPEGWSSVMQAGTLVQADPHASYAYERAQPAWSAPHELSAQDEPTVDFSIYGAHDARSGHELY